MAPLKEIDKLGYGELKREAVLRGVFKIGQMTTGMKNAVKEHREENPNFDLEEAAQKVLNKGKNKSPESPATPVEKKTGEKMGTKKAKKTVKKAAKKVVKKKGVAKKAKKVAEKKAPVKKVAEVKVKPEAKIAAPAPKEGEHGAIRAHIMKLYAAGKKPAEIEKETGYNKNTIYGTGQHYRKSVKAAK